MKNNILISLLVLFTSCKAIPPETKSAYSKDQPRDITLFIDGTFNTRESNTNITKLYNLSLENKKRASFYTVGVGGGPDQRWLGNMFGTGIGNDVREAYQFICRNYSQKRKDNLHLFGFSRGAYTSKVLANFIYVTGVLNLNGISREDEENIVKQLYRAYRGKGDFSRRKERINKIVAKWEKKLNMQILFQNKVKIETMNLFDTVEALSAPDYTEKVCYPNSNHLAQFINVKQINHAMSLDDNRARIFTPILASCNEIAVNGSIDDIVNEVWFAGAHSDIGGGYSDNDRLSNVSLRWLMGELEDYDLFEIPTFNDNDKFEKIHDAEGDGINKFIYKRMQRNLPRYLKQNKGYYNSGELKIHQSVMDRLSEGRYNEAPILPSKKDTIWYDREPFRKCFTQEGSRRIFQKKNCTVIDTIISKI